MCENLIGGLADLFFFFFFGLIIWLSSECVTRLSSECVVCLCVISVFIFGGSLGVFVCWVGLVGGCVCVFCVHILPKFQFWKFQFWN